MGSLLSLRYVCIVRKLPFPSTTVNNNDKKTGERFGLAEILRDPCSRPKISDLIQTAVAGFLGPHAYQEFGVVLGYWHGRAMHIRDHSVETKLRDKVR